MDDQAPTTSDKILQLSPDNDTCIKLKLPEYFLAYLNKKELYRYTDKIDVRDDVLDRVCNNYVIVKNIIRYLPWRDKLICTNVCTLWNSATKSLEKEQMSPSDFSINLTLKAMRRGIAFKKSAEFYVAPLVTLVYCNGAAINDYGTAKCLALVPSPCSPPCEKEHSLLDVIHQQTSAPGEIFVTKAYNIAYLPLPRSITYENALKKIQHNSIPYYCGLYIPRIPGVEFRAISTPSARENTAEMIKELQDMAEECVIKAIILNVTDHYMLFVEQGFENFFTGFSAVQSDIPYALGGCLVEDTFAYQEALDDIIISANGDLQRIFCKQVSLGIFMVPKKLEVKPSFEVYSCIIESAAWSKPQIHQEIRDFSKRIPHFEQSVALKLSCAGRMSRHETEQNYFRSFFPDTPIVGAYGNGEFGTNWPPRQATEQPAKKSKKQKVFENSYSYSTVFMYFGWGKVVKPTEDNTII